jgi:hypothetical protein
LSKEKYPKEMTPAVANHSLAYETARAVRIQDMAQASLSTSGLTFSLSCILTGGFPAATLLAQPALFQRAPVAPAWGLTTGKSEVNHCLL